MKAALFAASLLLMPVQGADESNKRGRNCERMHST